MATVTDEVISMENHLDHLGIARKRKGRFNDCCLNKNGENNNRHYQEDQAHSHRSNDAEINIGCYQEDLMHM